LPKHVDLEDEEQEQELVASAELLNKQELGINAPNKLRKMNSKLFDASVGNRKRIIPNASITEASVAHSPERQASMQMTTLDKMKKYYRDGFKVQTDTKDMSISQRV
jgi:hypothetical protein